MKTKVLTYSRHRFLLLPLQFIFTVIRVIFVAVIPDCVGHLLKILQHFPFIIWITNCFSRSTAPWPSSPASPLPSCSSQPAWLPTPQQHGHLFLGYPWADYGPHILGGWLFLSRCLPRGFPGPPGENSPNNQSPNRAWFLKDIYHSLQLSCFTCLFTCF